MDFRLSDHAKKEMERRQIPEDVLDSVMRDPQQIVPETRGRKAYQSQISFGGKMFLVRAIVVEGPRPPLVVTVYRTSKISKYWR
jgi:hypothetical protein